MADNNPIDEDLLRELGLEPKDLEVPVPKPASPPPSAAPGAPKQAAAPMPPRPQKPATPGAMPSGAPLINPNLSAPPPARKAPPMARAAEPDDPVRFQDNLKNLAEDMPVQVLAVLGKRSMTLKDLIALKQGEIIELKKLPQDAIDLVANGKLVARGELVLVEGKLGIQIKQLVG